MAKVRLVGSESRIVPWLGAAVIEPDQIVEIPDGDYGAYVCQPAVWESVEEPASSKSTKRAQAPATRPSTGKDGD